MKKMSAKPAMIMGFIIYLCSLFFAGHMSKFTGDMLFFEAVGEATKSVQANPLDFLHFDTAPFVIFTMIYAIWVVYYLTEFDKRKMERPRVEHGSAKWMTDFDGYSKKFSSPFGKTQSDGKDNMILSQNIKLSMDTRKTFLNDNVIIIGGSGAGKTRYFLKPNLLQANASYVITDPSGEILASCRKFLEKEGYEVKVFNTVEMENSMCYNPFNYIRDETGVITMITTLLKNTTPPKASQGDPFWEKSETALLQAICYFLYYEVPKEDQNFGNVMTLLRAAEVKEDNDDYKSPLDMVFEELKERDPEHIAVRSYAIFKQAAGKTAKSILISASVRLQHFNLKAVQRLTNTDTIDMATIGDKKTVLFCITPIADTSFNYLVAMLYTQLFETLYFHAETECKGKRLPCHTRFLLDEFPNIGTIPDFDQKLATMRKYEISASIVCQSPSQLKKMYKDEYETLLDNCSSMIFLGGQGQEVLEFISKKLGKETIIAEGTSRSRGKSGSTSRSRNLIARELMAPNEVGKIDNRDCIVFIKGLDPIFDKKYDYPKHPNYKYTGDADDNLLFDIHSIHTPELPDTTSIAKQNEEEFKTLEAEVANANDERIRNAEIRETTTLGKHTYEITDAQEAFEEDPETIESIEFEDCFDPDYSH